MRLRYSPFWLVMATSLLLGACSTGQDEQLGDNPVLGSEGPGAIAETDATNYGGLALIAVGLIVVGMLFVKAESWHRKRQ